MAEGGRKELRQPGEGLAGSRFSAGASNQISLMKWIYGIQPDEPEATASMPMLPKTALPGGFALVIGHFISEITDCTQQQKTGPLPAPFPAAAFPFAPVGCPSTMAFIKIDFCGKDGVISVGRMEPIYKIRILCYNICILKNNYIH